MARILSARVLASLVIIALPLAMGALVARRAVDIPSWDEWEWADLVYKMHLGTLQFSDVWTQHNEHRMLLPNLLILALARFGGWDPVREQFLSLGVLVLSQLAILVMIQRTSRAPFRTAAGLIASLLLYGIWQSENLGWGFQLAWFLCNLSAIAVALLLGQKGRRPAHVLLALFVAVLGSFSSSQGLVVWAVGAVAIVLTFRRRVLTLVIWAIAATITYRIYRHGMYAVESGHFNLLAHPIAAANYILAYLGSPVAREFGAGVSTVAGLIVMCALFASLVSDIRSQHRVRRLLRNASWYALAAFPILCAIATASGRAGYGVDQALASRYTTISGLTWVVAVALAATRGINVGRLTIGARYALVAGGTIFACAFVASTTLGWHEWRAQSSSLALARSELIQNNPAALPVLYPVRARVLMLLGEMRAVHDGPFAGN
jgi:hypothetical protein